MSANPAPAQGTHVMPGGLNPVGVIGFLVGDNNLYTAVTFITGGVLVAMNSMVAVIQ